LSDAGSERLVWSFFVIGGQPSLLRLGDQLRYGIRALGDAPSAGVVALAAECNPDCAHARETLEALSAAVLPTLIAALEQ